MQRPIIISVGRREIPSQTGTKDLQTVNISSASSGVGEERLPKIYRSLGADFAERVLPSSVTRS